MALPSLVIGAFSEIRLGAPAQMGEAFRWESLIAGIVAIILQEG